MVKMLAGNCNVMTQDRGFFDITHTFKVGLSTYHVLGFRKDRPTYKHTYYIFNCANDQHESTNNFQSKSLLPKRSARAAEQTSLSKRRPQTAHHTTTTSVDETTTMTTADRILKTKSTTSHSRARTESPKKLETELTLTTETFTKAMRSQRHMLVTSFRKEMNIKKKVLLRSIKKEKQELLQATTEANKKEEIIRLLQEQNNSLTSVYEQFVNTTTASIDTLKETLTEMLDAQRNTSQSTGEVQVNLLQTIQQEVQQIISKNEEILKSTSIEINAISQLQDTLVEKIENYSTAKEQDNDATLSRLFAEQKQALTDVVEQQQQQQQVPSLDLIKQAMIDALGVQQSTTVNTANNTEHSQQPVQDTITNISSLPIHANSKVIPDNTTQVLPSMKSNEQSHTLNQSLPRSSLRRAADQHLFKISVRTPEPAHVFAKLAIAGVEYSRRLHTLCQRDPFQNDIYNCYITPPMKDGPYEITIYAKTDKETTYQAAICIRLPGANISQSIIFPMIHQAFDKHHCFLMEPFQRLLRRNEYVLIHMIVPGAFAVKIRNGDDNIELDEHEYKNDVVKKKIRVRGNVCVTGCWDKKTDSTICVFNTV